MDEESFTCYHEAGHVVVGYLLGGRIEQVQLGGESHENLPAQFGDCLIQWQQANPNCPWQIQRELLTILAGPVAEMVYRGEKFHPAHFGPWQLDWMQAMQRCVSFTTDMRQRTQLLEALIEELYVRLQRNEFWAAIAAVADELSAHEYLEREQLEACLQFWL